MIVLKCCGETYRAEDRHIGFSIRCRVCKRIIPVGRSEVEKFSPRQISNRARKATKPLRTWFIPVLGLVALVLGVSLVIANWHSRTPETVLAREPTPTPRTNEYSHVAVHPSPTSAPSALRNGS